MSPSDQKKFVEQMLMANFVEIQLDQMAAERASSPEVKSFAQTMVTDHTQANQDLEPIARQIGVQRPTELDAKHRRLSERLSTLQAQEFDREYLKEMVEAHRTWSRRVGRSPTTPPRHRIGLRREVRRREVRRSAPAAAAG